MNTAANIDGKYVLLSMVAMLGSRKIVSEVQEELDFLLDNPVVKVFILYAIIDLVVKNSITSMKLTFVLLSIWLFYKIVFTVEEEEQLEQN